MFETEKYQDSENRLYLDVLDTSKELNSRLGRADMLQTDAETLREDSSSEMPLNEQCSNTQHKTLLPDSLVDDDSETALGDVEDTASASVIHLVGHTLLQMNVRLSERYN